MFHSANITVMISEMERSIDFYVNKLGLRLKNRYGDYWAEIEGPGITIGLHPTSAPISRGENMQIALGVKDLEKEVADLEKKGVVFGMNNEPNVKIASFTDPDHNVLYLVQPTW